MRYEITEADRASLPRSYSREPRYLGYRDADAAQPYAHYFRPLTRPVQEHVVHALVAGKQPAEFGYGIAEAADRLALRGHQNLESGWTRLASGVLQVNVLTPMPGVTAQMWDWWFGWHSRESARYKLWHPEAHLYSALGQDRGEDSSLTDRQRYVDNVSYVDEYIGGDRQSLAIRFVSPERMGIDPVAGTTHICARVSLSTLPVAIGWIIHQVRPTDEGAEMRSRFFLNDTELLSLPSRALPARASALGLSSCIGRAIAGPVLPLAAGRLVDDTLATDMLVHCASEMNHLAEFLPELYEEFRDTM